MHLHTIILVFTLLQAATARPFGTPGENSLLLDKVFDTVELSLMSV